MSATKRVGFIGLGNMGTPMAANLVRAGHDVVAYDLARNGHGALRRRRRHAPRKASPSWARTPRSSITMLPSGREVREALLEAQGGALAANLQPGRDRHRHELGRPGRHARARRRPRQRATSRWSMPRSPAACRARPTARSPSWSAASCRRRRRQAGAGLHGQELFEVGSLGCGHAMKALNNFLAATSLAAGAEASRSDAVRARPRGHDRCDQCLDRPKLRSART